MIRALTLSLAIFLCALGASGQLRTVPPPKPAQKIVRLTYTPRQNTLSVSAGIAYPRTYEGLTKYWTGGPNGSLKLLFGCSRYFKVGVGVDLSLLYFRKAAVSESTSGPAVKAEDITLLNAYVMMRWYARPALRFSPFLGVEFGGTRMSPASYRSVVGGEEITYYDTPGSSHLSAGASAGLDYYISRSVAIEVEGRGHWVDGNPDLGLVLYGVIGLKFTL